MFKCFKDCYTINLLDEIKDNIFFVSVAYNNSYILKVQIEFFKMYSSYNICVIDNSDDHNIIKENQKICFDNDVSYIYLPEFCRNSKFNSINHSLALNWFYHNYIKYIDYDFFCFLHHDVFPIREVTIYDYIKDKEFYGKILTSHGKNKSEKEVWTLDPCFSFFSRRFLENKYVDFSPCYDIGLDTGGSNWYYIFKYIEKHDNFFCNGKCIRLSTDDMYSNFTQLNSISIFDNSWIHYINASKWFEKKMGLDIANSQYKVELFEKVLELYK